MYTVAVLLVFLWTLNSAEDLNTNKSDCIFNETANITPQDLFRCRIMRDDWNSSEISIPELNSYFDFQIKFKNSNKALFNDSYYRNTCKKFNKITQQIYKNASNISEVEISCKLVYVYEIKRVFNVLVLFPYLSDESSYSMLYRDFLKKKPKIFKNLKFTLWKDLLTNRYKLKLQWLMYILLCNS